MQFAMTNDEARKLLLPVDVLALTMFGEARGEPVEGRIAVGCVIRNRLMAVNSHYSSYAEVCWARLQFSCWNEADPNSKLLWDKARSLASGIKVLDAVFTETRFIAEGVVLGSLRDNTNGATNYFSPRSMVPAGRWPDWAKGHTPVATVGGHLFFKGV